jgi:hypothetical protein
MDQDELTNRRVHAIARVHDCTVADVHEALDKHPIELDRDKFLRRTLAIELLRLGQPWPSQTGPEPRCGLLSEAV